MDSPDLFARLRKIILEEYKLPPHTSRQALEVQRKVKDLTGEKLFIQNRIRQMNPELNNWQFRDYWEELCQKALMTL